MSEKRFLPVAVAAERIGVSKRTVERMVVEGRIPDTEIVRIGQTRIAEDIVEQLARERERQAFILEQIADLKDALHK